MKRRKHAARQDRRTALAGYAAAPTRSVRERRRTLASVRNDQSTWLSSHTCWAWLTASLKPCAVTAQNGDVPTSSSGTVVRMRRPPSR